MSIGGDDKIMSECIIKEGFPHPRSIPQQQRERNASSVGLYVNQRAPQSPVPPRKGTGRDHSSSSMSASSLHHEALVPLWETSQHPMAGLPPHGRVKYETSTCTKNGAPSYEYGAPRVHELRRVGSDPSSRGESHLPLGSAFTLSKENAYVHARKESSSSSSSPRSPRKKKEEKEKRIVNVEYGVGEDEQQETKRGSAAAHSIQE